MEPTPDEPSTSDRVIVAAFLACLALPAALTFASSSTQPMTAMGEVPVERPDLDGTWKSIGRYPRTHRDWFNANFALRGPLISAFARVKREALDASPNAKVVLGKDGWLFYAAEHEDECCRNARPYDDGQVSQIAQALEARRARLEAMGVAYLLVVAPDKHTVYPEFQPASVRRVRGTSRFDQLLERLRADTRVDVLDLRPALAEAKRTDVVYRRLDTHWNELGAFVAYGRIVDALAKRFPEMRAASRDDFELSREPRAGDLSKMLGLSDALEEETPVLVRRRPAAARFVAGVAGEVTDLGHREVDVLASVNAQLAGPRVVMFRDSFASAVLPFLAEHFAKATYLKTMGLAEFDERVVETERPDVVVEEVVERALMLDAAPGSKRRKGAR